MCAAPACASSTHAAATALRGAATYSVTGDCWGSIHMPTRPTPRPLMPAHCPCRASSSPHRSSWPACTRCAHTLPVMLPAHSPPMMRPCRRAPPHTRMCQAASTPTPCAHARGQTFDHVLRQRRAAIAVRNWPWPHAAAASTARQLKRTPAAPAAATTARQLKRTPLAHAHVPRSQPSRAGWVHPADAQPRSRRTSLKSSCWPEITA
jgi:hypothetical protein